jgi:thymidylate synthase
MGMQDHIEKLFSDSDKLTPLTMDEFINKIKTDDEFAKQWGDLGPIYGKQWRKWVGQDQTAKGSLSASTTFGYVDQIQNLINDLKTNPDSRRLMVSAWNVGELDQMVLPPCHYGFQVYTRELNLDERIEILRSITDPFNFHSDYFHEHLDYYNIPRRTISLMWNQRSVDTFLGLPFNIASYGLLLEIIAKMVNMVPDELIGNLGDTHLYLNHIEQAKEQIERKPFDSLPTLNINTEFWSYKGGECGEGPLDAIAILNSFKDDNFCKCLLEEDLQLSNYQSHPTIKAPLKLWIQVHFLYYQLRLTSYKDC